MTEPNQTFVVRKTSDIHGVDSLVARNYPEWCTCKWDSEGTRLTPVRYFVNIKSANNCADRLFRHHGNS